MVALPEVGGISRVPGSLMMPSAQGKASGRHMSVALLRIKVLAFKLGDIGAGAVRDMQHDSNRHLGLCCHDIAAGAVWDLQHE